MDILKVFVDEPAPLGVLAGPDAASLHDLLAATNGAPAYGRAYLAGTHLPDSPAAALRVGLTALGDSEAYTRPLLAWAGARTWTRLGHDGRASGLIAPEAAALLRAPGHTVALAVADGPVAADRLAAALAGTGRDAQTALRAALDADASLAILQPEPAHDGADWSLVARSPLRETLVAALRAAPVRPGTRRFVVPHRSARGEHTFYFEQWGLDAPPRGTEEILTP
jgi:hypothetical protein